MSGISPIPTRYKGYHFRSRLEARWAVFFDAMGIAWEYEPQGFDIDGTWYLPDFRLTDSGTWIEVKGREGDLDRELMEAAARLLPPAELAYWEWPTLLLLGNIPAPPDEGFVGWSWIGLKYVPIPGEYDGPRFVVAEHWSFTPASFPSHPLRPGDTSCATSWDAYEPLLEPVGDLSTVVNGANVDLEPDAYRAARSARFEHGQSGAT